VAIPYFRAKEAGLHKALGGGPVNDDLLDDKPERLSHLPNTNDSRMGQIKSTALNCFQLSYPYFIAMTEFSHFIFGLNYLFGKSPSWRVSQAYTGIEIRRISGGPLRFWPKKRSVAALFVVLAPLRCATALLAAKTAQKPL
jgi:hypothetical protein